MTELALLGATLALPFVCAGFFATWFITRSIDRMETRLHKHLAQTDDVRELLARLDAKVDMLLHWHGDITK